MRRLVLAGTFVVALAAGTPTAQAADPVLLTGCAASAQAESGQQIVLSPDAVIEPITKVLGPLDPLGALTPPFRDLWHAQPPIVLGSGPGVIRGAAIADAVVGRLRQVPVLAPVIDAVIAPVRSVLTMTCGVLVQPIAPPAGAPAPGPGSPGVPGSSPHPGAPAAGPAPALPAAAAPANGQAAGAPVPPFYNATGLPGPGLLSDGIAFDYGGVPQTLAVNVDPRAVDASLASAGRADALAMRDPGPPRLPFLLATLVLTLVTAQFVRTWVLRRSTPPR
jgi:hypothetical protein